MPRGALRAATRPPRRQAAPDASLLARLKLRRHETVRLAGWHRELGDIYVFMNLADLQQQARFASHVLRDVQAITVAQNTDTSAVNQNERPSSAAAANPATQMPAQPGDEVQSEASGNSGLSGSDGSDSSDTDEEHAQRRRAPAQQPAQGHNSRDNSNQNNRPRAATKARLAVSLRHLAWKNKNDSTDDESSSDSDDSADLPHAESSVRVLATTTSARTAIHLSAADSLIVTLPLNKARSQRCLYTVAAVQNIVEGLAVNGIVHRAVVTLDPAPTFALD